jgi:hypothetical protein
MQCMLCKIIFGRIFKCTTNRYATNIHFYVGKILSLQEAGVTAEDQAALIDREVLEKGIKSRGGEHHEISLCPSRCRRLGPEDRPP